ncbi:hypothetical protein ASF20_17135 [Methylobacterium sp. Leaf88]|nr:hypothetical protein ASF20_17135 [Methylobacterium sp. Leaf88]
MTSPLLGELLGTMVLIILGKGVVAGALLARLGGGRRGLNRDHRWLGLRRPGWAFAVLAGIFVAAATGKPDAHTDPAVTIAAAIASGSHERP